MKFRFEVIDDEVHVKALDGDAEIIHCVANFKKLKKDYRVKKNFINSPAICLVRYEDEAIEKTGRKAIVLLKESLDEMNKSVAKRGKQNLTDLEKDALKKIPVEYKWLACDKPGAVYVYANKPKRDDSLGSWHDCANDGAFMYVVNKAIIPSLFEWCKWEDEPWYIPDLLG